jgi:hypothetical protein
MFSCKRVAVRVCTSISNWTLLANETFTWIFILPTRNRYPMQSGRGNRWRHCRLIFFRATLIWALTRTIIKKRPSCRLPLILELVSVIILGRAWIKNSAFCNVLFLREAIMFNGNVRHISHASFTQCETMIRLYERKSLPSCTCLHLK